MATIKTAGWIDNVGPNIFVHTKSAEQGFGPRHYVRPSSMQCHPPRLHHFKKNNGTPLPSQYLSLRQGDPKPRYKQGAFYRDVKLARYAQLEAHRLRHEFSDEIRHPFEEVIYSDVAQDGWLAKARTWLAYVQVRDTLLREPLLNYARWHALRDRRRRERQEVEKMQRRQQTMRKSIALNGERRRQMLRNSRTVWPQHPARGLSAWQIEQMERIAQTLAVRRGLRRVQRQQRLRDSADVLQHPPEVERFMQQDIARRIELSDHDFANPNYARLSPAHVALILGSPVGLEVLLARLRDVAGSRGLPSSQTPGRRPSPTQAQQETEVKAEDEWESASSAGEEE